ncbi:CHAT domain-containing protein [Pseudomonas aeruginosa]|uniref:CHAT domain-containing protein n=1 Tax=Pseudomonas aeruginosa TaxID=287 RepID=UPI001245266D|nr:CHAT domain-containing protein [Pseudomonas aeruginosa]KAB0740515.1 CHAT domain-containing protein [Pseudomonas aeruginosa]MCW5425217.1 CHAT domain-containing protein [Pseudomonas aeruginosa]MCW5431437.1 CHAT domain-containing protein [Pseudomonas aeruginosa]
MSDGEKNAQARIRGFDPRILFTKGLQLETADLVVGAATDETVGRLSAISFLALNDRNGAQIFLNVTIVAPPFAAWPLSDDDILEHVRKGFLALNGQSLGERELESVRRRLVIRRCPDLDTKGLLTQISSLTRTLVIVPMAHIYRDAAVTDVENPGRAASRLVEHLWVPHLATWSDKCIKSLADSDNYLVLATPENPPTDERLREQLNSVENLYPVYLLNDAVDPINRLISENASRWTGLAVCGRVDEALSEIWALDVEEPVKRQLEIQALNRSGFRERTLSALEAYVEKGFDLTPDLAVRFGRIAYRSDAPHLAARLIGDGVDSALDIGLLEKTLVTCDSMGDGALALRVSQRLKSLFPESPFLDRYREGWLIKLSGATDLSPFHEALPTLELLGFESEIAKTLLSPSDAGIDALIVAAGDETTHDKDLASLCGATYALARLDAKNAINRVLSISPTGLFKRRAAWLLIGAMRRVFLRSAPGDDVVGIIQPPLAYLRHYLSANPDDVEAREAFTALFAVESSASLGTPILIAQTLSLAHESRACLVQNNPKILMATAVQVDRFLDDAEAWLGKVGVYDVSHTEIPAELIQGEPLALLNALESLVRKISIDPEGSLEYAEHLSFLACGVARHVSDTTADINALRFVACCYAGSGQTQRARDRAEQILELTGDSVARQRAAWVAFADIYHRTRGPLPALLGLAFALELKHPVSADELWWEGYTLIRVARDLGLTEYAQTSLDHLRQVTALLDEPADTEKRIRTLELSLRLIGAQHLGDAMQLALLDDATQHCSEVLQGWDEILPATVILAQSIGLLEHSGNAGGSIDHARETLEKALARIEASQANYVRAMTAGDPTIEDILHLTRRVDPARNSGDAPGDLRVAEISARRFLKAGKGALSPDAVATTLELISDRALDPLQNARELETQWPLEYAHTLCPEDGAVMMLGTDSEGALVTLTVEQGQTVVSTQDASETDFATAVEDWAKAYPHRYGYINREEGNNEFFLSMADLHVPIPEAKRLIVVAEPGVQQVPINLALINDNFAGYQRAIGYVPSLTWLEAKSRQPRILEPRRVAWISEATGGHENDVLIRVLERNEYTLREHGFEVETQGKIPSTLKAAQIAVVAAHGDVGAGGRFFHRVSDEGNLVVSPTALANALEGSDLAILFVCSGGRTDKHPHGNTAVGLPKHLLSRGCRTVIASPWPLFASIAGPWLESFLRSWDEGVSALDATFIANQAVEKHFGNVPQYSLAMTVYGDVLMTKV